jgi:hypothetical protein
VNRAGELLGREALDRLGVLHGDPAEARLDVLRDGEGPGGLTGGVAVGRAGEERDGEDDPDHRGGEHRGDEAADAGGQGEGRNRGGVRRHACRVGTPAPPKQA